MTADGVGTRVDEDDGVGAARVDDEDTAVEDGELWSGGDERAEREDGEDSTVGG